MTAKWWPLTVICGDAQRGTADCGKAHQAAAQFPQSRSESERLWVVGWVVVRDCYQVQDDVDGAYTLQRPLDGKVTVTCLIRV